MNIPLICGYGAAKSIQTMHVLDKTSVIISLTFLNMKTSIMYVYVSFLLTYFYWSSLF